jgi:hypothetical protein
MRGVGLLLLVAGCGTSVTRTGGVDLRSTDGGAPGDLLSLPDGFVPPPDGPTFNKDAACAQVSEQATLVKKPVDVIFVIDNSGSMTDEIVAVENNINQNFAKIIENSGIDYRVIMVTHHGLAPLDQSVCVGKPLSGHDCRPLPALVPVNTARFFHYTIEVGSSNSFAKVLEAYNKKDPSGAGPGGFSDWLRMDALKVFIEITDDSSNMNADDFEKRLFALQPKQFGDANNRNYIFHTIAGFKENNPATKPWAPGDPLQNAKCTRGGGAVSPGVEYQKLSQLTGGLRFPICEHQSFDAVFQAAAMGVISGAVVACDFTVPTPPPGQKIDLKTVVVDYTPMGMGAPIPFKQVAGAPQCGPDSFYIDAGKIFLCPDACQKVKGDGKAKIVVSFDCDAPIG